MCFENPKFASDYAADRIKDLIAEAENDRRVHIAQSKGHMDHRFSLVEEITNLFRVNRSRRKRI